jgi:hypothetical protein
MASIFRFFVKTHDLKTLQGGTAYGIYDTCDSHGV